MNTHADKTQENKSQAMANTVSQNKSGGESTFQFINNRPEAIVQRKLQERANNSSQAKQAAQLQAMAKNYSAQQQNPIQKKENDTGLPDDLKAGIENLSGYSMDDVKVHRNSDKPAQLQAHAYAQGTDIHLASGQEKHLPHEAWHVVQQKQGRVKPILQMKGKVNVNDDVDLEKEANTMGDRATQMSANIKTERNIASKKNFISNDLVQRQLIVNGTDADFRAALNDVLALIRNSADSDTKTLLQYAETDDYVDLVIRNDIPWYKQGLEGLTSVKVRYGTDGETHIKDEILEKNKQVITNITDKLTIVVRVGLPIMAFWNRNQGRLASTLLHELSIHAARNVPLIDRLRFDNRADALLGEQVWAGIRGVFDIEDSHHAALKVGNSEDDFRKQYRELTNSLIDFYRNRGDNSKATALHKAYWDDLWEHSPGIFPIIAQVFGITLSDDI